MEENKYYTPEPEELHIGYTCEACFSSYAGFMIFDLQNPENSKLHEPVDKEAAKNWAPFFLIQNESLFTANNTRNHETALMLLKDNRLRTKYLDREDIKSLGWKLVHEEVKSYSHWCKFQSKDWEMHVQLGSKFFPRLLNFKARGHCYWNGNVNIECKSINELKVIMKLLKIQ